MAKEKPAEGAEGGTAEIIMEVVEELQGDINVKDEDVTELAPKERNVDSTMIDGGKGAKQKKPVRPAPAPSSGSENDLEMTEHTNLLGGKKKLIRPSRLDYTDAELHGQNTASGGAVSGGDEYRQQQLFAADGSDPVNFTPAPGDTYDLPGGKGQTFTKQRLTIDSELKTSQFVNQNYTSFGNGENGAGLATSYQRGGASHAAITDPRFIFGQGNGNFQDGGTAIARANAKRFKIRAGVGVGIVVIGGAAIFGIVQLTKHKHIPSPQPCDNPLTCP